MSTEINANSDDDGSYYSRLLRRKVRKPTPVLYNMIIQGIRYEYKEVTEDQICERCKTHPDDVNWFNAYTHCSPFFLFVSTRYDTMMDKARNAMIESDSFRVFDELIRLDQKRYCPKLFSRLLNKLIVLKPNYVVEMFVKHDLSLDVATVIVSYLYGEKEQLAALTALLKSSDNIKCPSFHLVDDWISLHPEVLSTETVCYDMINAIESCTKTCCALILLRNVQISMELLPISTYNLPFSFVFNCVGNTCICISDDLVKLSLEILDLVIDRSGEEELFGDGYTLLHDIAMRLKRPSEGCCMDKWLSFLRKIVDRFPVEVLSMQNMFGHTPYDYLIRNYQVCQYVSQDKNLYKKVLHLFKPR